MTLSIKNWKHFQHFKDRRPPWIKLYRELLDDLEWHQLDPKAAKVLVMLWLIASEAEGELPEMKQLAFRLRMSENELLKVISMLSHWLGQDDINVISSRYQGDTPETETEAEAEAELKEANASLCPQHQASPSLPDCPHGEILKLWQLHLPHLAQPRTWDGARRESLRARWAQASRKSDWSTEGYSDAAGGLKFWGAFFQYLKNDTKLSDGFESNGRLWKPDLEWVCKASNFAKIIDGKYDK